jgi:hypothetical protein
MKFQLIIGLFMISLFLNSKFTDPKLVITMQYTEHIYDIKTVYFGTPLMFNEMTQSHHV